MSMSLIQTINNWKRSALLLGLLPFIFLGTIFIVFGDDLSLLFSNENSTFHFLKLPNQLSAFKSNIELSRAVRALGRLSILLLNIIFVFWLCLQSAITYLKLSQQIAYKAELAIELFLIMMVYLFIISPANLLLYILGCLILSLHFALIIFYWIYQVRTQK